MVSCDKQTVGIVGMNQAYANQRLFHIEMGFDIRTDLADFIISALNIFYRDCLIGTAHKQLIITQNRAQHIVLINYRIKCLLQSGFYVLRPTLAYDELPRRLPGDLNGDEAVNAKDVTILRRFIAGGYGVTAENAAADANGDSAVNAKDVTVLRRFIAGGYGVTLG